MSEVQPIVLDWDRLSFRWLFGYLVQEIHFWNWAFLPFIDPGWSRETERHLSSPGLSLHEEPDGVALPCTREDYQSEDLSAWCRKWGQCCWTQQLPIVITPISPNIVINNNPNDQVIELRRPTDSRLEHVDFDSLFSCLSVRQVIRVFASLLLERRVIFVADKLRWGFTVIFCIIGQTIISVLTLRLCQDLAADFLHVHINTFTQ